MNLHAVRLADGPIVGQIRPPGSKSYTNRALPIAAVARGVSTITNALESEDVDAMLGALKTLGVQFSFDRSLKRIEIRGCGGPFPPKSASLNLVNSGTSLRFLAALVAAGQGTFTLDGNNRMGERPVADLLDGLRQLGVKSQCLAAEGRSPFELNSNGLSGGRIEVKADVSSQYLSGLLMAAPLAKAPVEIHLRGGLVSKPYVQMTLATMKSFGVEVDRSDENIFRIAPQQYQGCEYAVEPDASAASYWFAAAAITKGRVTVEGLGRKSLQGDLGFIRILEWMGCSVEQTDDSTTIIGGDLRGGDFDLHDMSDLVPTLAAVACFANGPTTIRNVANVRVKESDRITAMATELGRLGLKVDEFADGLTVVPSSMTGATVETYDDHRIAMSLALVGLKAPGVVVSDPDCVRKTYPDFWRDLERLCGRYS